jgi:hypothetical protein
MRTADPLRDARAERRAAPRPAVGRMRPTPVPDRSTSPSGEGLS